ncbi:MAG: Gfo/Idh/MocA family protein, partial [Limisphaerales bacterium]
GGGGRPNGRVRVGVMGLSRGLAHVEALKRVKNVEVAWVCDVDRERLGAGVERASAGGSGKVRGTDDFRRMLEDASLDAVTIAAPNHWHAPAAMLACDAGKHVYVEKPGSHNVREADWLVEVAERTGRRVQLGTQRRSWPAVREMVERLHGGVIGRVTYARGWYSNARGSIGRGRMVSVPEGLNYALWQGPAPSRVYLDNLVHYNWHWRWHWGGGELANNGVHALDLMCWGLKVGHPRRVTFHGGRYHFGDDQETPDTAVATYDFGEVGASWDTSSCVPRREEDLPFVAFSGVGGGVVNGGGGYIVYDEQGKEVSRREDEGGDVSHFENFVGAIRGEIALHAWIGEGQKAARLCHLGNIAYRSGMVLDVDQEDGGVVGVGSAAAAALWGREYERVWGKELERVTAG